MPAGINPISTLATEDVLLTLAAFNAKRLAPALPTPWLRPDIEGQVQTLFMEHEFLERCRLEVAAQAGAVLRNPGAFVTWFENLLTDGPGQGDPLFAWLADHASWEDMRWFIAQEMGGEAGFDDLVALTQVKMPMRAKLEMARNFWDEMGRGREQGAHGNLLLRLAEEFAISHADIPVLAEPVALNVLMMGLACNRQYAYHALGALGAIELTAPSRVAFVAKGLARLGVSRERRLYYDLHATLDVAHAKAWNSEVLMTIMSLQPEAATALAEGALMRLTAGARCFHRFREHFGLEVSTETKREHRMEDLSAFSS